MNSSDSTKDGATTSLGSQSVLGDRVDVLMIEAEQPAPVGAGWGEFQAEIKPERDGPREPALPTGSVQVQRTLAALTSFFMVASAVALSLFQNCEITSWMAP